MARSSIAAVMQALATPHLETYQSDSPYAIMLQGMGHTVRGPSQNLTNNGATTINQFVISAGCIITRLYLNIATVSNSTTFSTVGWELSDGGATPDLTGDQDCSGVESGSLLIKTNLLANAGTILDGATAVTADPGLAAIYAPVFALPHNTGTTYIRMRYTGDANTDVTVRAYLQYICLSDPGTECIVSV